MGFSDVLMQMLGYGPSQQAAQQTNVNRAQQSTQLQDEYSRAQADPNSGVGLTPAMQAMQEQELSNSVRSKMSDAGAGKSGAANSGVQKAIVDYRIGQMAQHQKYLDSLRQGMLTASTPQTQQQTTGQQMMGSMAGRAGEAMGNGLFGEDPNQKNQGGMNVTINGQDPRGQGPNGPNGRGPNNSGSYGT